MGGGECFLLSQTFLAVQGVQAVVTLNETFEVFITTEQYQASFPSSHSQMHLISCLPKAQNASQGKASLHVQKLSVFMASKLLDDNNNCASISLGLASNLSHEGFFPLFFGVALCFCRQQLPQPLQLEAHVLRISS